MPKKILKISIPKNWIEAFKKNNLDTNLDLPIKNISKELEDNKKIAPNINNIFRAFELCKYESTRVVIFGHQFLLGQLQALPAPDSFDTKKSRPEVVTVQHPQN